MQKPFSRVRSGFTLIELLVVIAIIAILAAILFPVFAQAREKARQSTCVSNMKQVSLGMIQYLQDYDELFPIAFSAANNAAGTPVAHWGVNLIGGQNVPIGTATPLLPNGVQVAGIIQPYLRNNQVLNCPSSIVGPSATSAAVAYMYNDLVAAASQAVLNGPAQTVILAESSPAIGRQAAAGDIPANQLRNNVGHAVTGPRGTAFTVVQAANPVLAETLLPANVFYPLPVALSEAADLDQVARHSDGGNFAYGDGHVKWARMNWFGDAATGHTTNIYFPPQAQVTRNALRAGFANPVNGCPAGAQPVPGENMCGFQGTFHTN